jgi:hypothetical protein
MRFPILLLFACMFLMQKTFSQAQHLTNLEVQNNNVEPRGIAFSSTTAFQGNAAQGYIGIQRKNYTTNATGSGNDRTDEVGFWIKGFYQAIGESMPIYLGGTGYYNDDFKMVIDKDGKIGIGTRSPQTLLDLKEIRFGQLSAFPAEGSVAEGVWANYIVGDATTSQKLRLGVSNDHFTRAEIFIDNSNRMDGTISFKTAATTGGALTRMHITGDGNIGIGVTDTKGYKLAVDGQGIFTKLRVQQQPWADFVFEPAYELIPLPDLEKFILAKKHLPLVPSAATVEKEGIDLGEMQAVLLQKIEELTLYIIDLNKKNEQQQQEINLLKKEIQLRAERIN